MGTSSLHCLKVEPNLRRSIGDALVPTAQMKVGITSLRHLSALTQPRMSYMSYLSRKDESSLS